jgi:hypothetical protein
MKRDIDAAFIEWKSDPRRQPLLICSAQQVTMSKASDGDHSGVP